MKDKNDIRPRSVPIGNIVEMCEGKPQGAIEEYLGRLDVCECDEYKKRDEKHLDDYARLFMLYTDLLHNVASLEGLCLCDRTYHEKCFICQAKESMKGE